MLPLSAHAATLIKGTSPAVYYLDEGKRYVFPNEKVFFSWYQDFSQVQSVTDQELASYLIGGNITYKPGLKLVKIQSDPKVYAVGAGGTLRWLTSEDAARTLYGVDWSKRVDDIPDAFFLNYRQGEPVASSADFDKDGESSVGSIVDDMAARNGTTVAQDFTALKYGAWSDDMVWGGKRPTSGARVTIPPNVKVIYDMEDAPSLKSLDIQGALEFYAGQSTRLAARQITVRGALNVGTSEAPLPANRRAEIVLTASSSGEDGMTVDGGTLSLHGDEAGLAWARLTAPAKKGAAAISVDPSILWPVGGEVAVLGATADDDPEIRKIVSVAGGKITLDAPLASAHRSEDGLRTEVALVSRNLVIRGVGGGAGSYVRAINRAKVDVSNVEFNKLGRMGVEGQYPLLLDGLLEGTVRQSVIRSSGNRCLVLRQTSGVTIDQVVALDAYGHCFATEEGAETGNVFSGDLAAEIHAGAMPEDAVPAAFFIKNPDNTLKDNVAVGSDGFGYWYDLPENATKNDGKKLKPRETALGVFSGNLARGGKKTGLYIDDNDKGRLNYAPDRKAVFSGLSAIMNGERGFWIRGSNIEVSGAYLAENPIGGTFAAFGASLKNSTVAGRLEGSKSPSPARYGFTYFDGPASVQDVNFKHFAGEAAALGFEEENPRLPDPRNSLRGAVFTDARAWRFKDPVTSGDAMAVVRDQDAGGTIAAKSAFLGPNCALDDDANAYRCTDAYAQLLVALRNSPGDKDVTITNLATKAAVTLKPGSAFDGQYAYANVAEGGSYRAAVPNVSSARVEYDGLAEPLLLRVPAGLGAQVKSEGQPLEKKELADLAPGKWAYDASTSEAVLWLNPGGAYELTR